MTATSRIAVLALMLFTGCQSNPPPRAVVAVRPPPDLLRPGMPIGEAAAALGVDSLGGVGTLNWKYGWVWSPLFPGYVATYKAEPDITRDGWMITEWAIRQDDFVAEKRN